MTDDADIWLRRERLETRRNPYPRIDYVVTVDGMINLPGRESQDDRAYNGSVTVRYVPDKTDLPGELLDITRPGDVVLYENDLPDQYEV